MTDFVVVGGGIAGVSAAARLSHLGTVTLFEAEPALGYHASGRSAAMFEENYGSASTVALNRASHDYLARENGGVLGPRGLLLVGSAGNTAAFEADMAKLGLAEIALDEAFAMVPILDPSAVSRAAHHATAQDIDTGLLLQGFAGQARANGAAIVTGARVETIRRTPAGWHVRAGAHEAGARILVNAAGAWADRVAALAGVAPLGLIPCRRSVALIPAPGGRDARGWPMLFGPGESWYAKPEAGKLIVSPADETPVEPHDAWAEEMTLAEGIARYQAVVTEPVTRVEHSWAGLRTFAPDRSLVIGFAPEAEGFFWLAGQGGYGMQTSPAASRLAADLIGGRAPALDRASVAALDPARIARA